MSFVYVVRRTLWYGRYLFGNFIFLIKRPKEKKILLFLGKVVDTVATLVCLENKNNISNAPKLKLFKNIDGTTVSEELDVLIEDLISQEVIFNGDLLIMEYIENDSGITEIDPSKYKWMLKNVFIKYFVTFNLSKQ